MYHCYSEIKYINYESFIQQIDATRNKAKENNNDLLNETNIKIDIDNINKIPDGRFSTVCNGVEFECISTGKNISKLYIVLNGSRSMQEKLPIFRRWSYYKYFDGIMLNIADPMLRKYDDINLGWYYGTENECYLDYIVTIVNKFARFLGIDNKNIIFFASSGGGYAALYCSSKINSCTALVINPQIRLSMYDHANTFEKKTGLDLKVNDKFGRNNLPLLIKNAPQTRFIILSNCRCKNDIEMLDDLCTTVGDNTFSYGLTEINEHIWTWVYDAVAKEPHNSQDYWPMVNCILQLVDMKKFPTDKGTYLLLNEFWYDRSDILYKDYIRDDFNEHNPTEIFSTVGNPISQMVPQRTLYKENLIIGSSDNQFNCFDFNVCLNPNTIYHLEIDGSKVLQGETTNLVFALGNQKYSRRNFSKKIDIGKKASVYFKTGKTDCIVLKLYPSNPGNCANISVKVYGLSLFCYEDQKQFIKIKQEDYDIFKSVAKGAELVEKYHLTDLSATYMIFNRHLGDAARTVKFVAPYKEYYSNDENYHFMDGKIKGINPKIFPKDRKTSRIVAITTQLLSGVVRLCPDVDEILTFAKEDIDCIEQYARAGISKRNNIIPDEQSKKDWTKDILTGGNSQAERLLIPSDMLKTKLGKAVVSRETLNETKKIIENCNIDTKKTIIILPYARSSSQLDMNVWKKIANTFKSWNYNVFTNVGKTETAIDGTTPLCVPVDVFCALAETGCLIVGIQNGLVDVLIRLELNARMYIISVIRTNEDLQYALNRGIYEDIVVKDERLTYFKNTIENDKLFYDKFIEKLSNELNKTQTKESS